MIQNKLIAFCKSKDITFTGYSPLGAPRRPWAKDDDVRLLDEPKLKEIANKYNKSPAQVLIRYQVSVRESNKLFNFLTQAGR